MALFGNQGCFMQFLKNGTLGRFTGFSGKVFRETGAESGPDLR
jgi:hypothetical protein